MTITENNNAGTLQREFLSECRLYHAGLNRASVSTDPVEKRQAYLDSRRHARRCRDIAADVVGRHPESAAWTARLQEATDAVQKANSWLNADLDRDYIAVVAVGAGSSFGRARTRQEAVKHLLRVLERDWKIDLEEGFRLPVLDATGHDSVRWDHALRFFDNETGERLTDIDTYTVSASDLKRAAA